MKVNIKFVPETSPKQSEHIDISVGQCQRAKTRAKDQRYKGADLNLIVETDYPRALE